MRYGAALVTVAVGLAAAALAFLPLALRHHAQPALPEIFDGMTRVYAVPLAGGHLKPVLRLHGQWDFPVATPEGQALLLERPQTAYTEVWRVPLDGTSPARVRRVGVFREPAAWNGGFLALERETDSATVRRIDLAVSGSNGHRVWTRPVPAPVGSPAVFADGRRVAQIRMHLLELVTAHGRRVLADNAGGFQPPLWTHDGQALVYPTMNEELVVRTIATGRVRTLARGPYFDDALSADGRTVYVLGRKDAVSIPK